MSGRPFAGAYPYEPIDPDDEAAGMSAGIWRSHAARPLRIDTPSELAAELLARTLAIAFTPPPLWPLVWLSGWR